MPDLVLLRHGQSSWNLENRFTGWTDVDLSDLGRTEALNAARSLKAAGYTFDLAFTSVLKRAIRTLWIVQDELDLLWIPVHHTWNLNERHYGALQGLNKTESVKEHGEAQVKIWRRSFATPPPPLAESDPTHPRFDRRYADLDPKLLPATESLADTCKRVIPFFTQTILPILRANKRIIIAAHGNSLRALVKHLDHLSEDAIAELNIPTGFPLVYSFDSNLKKTSHRYLGDPEAVKAAIEGVANQTKSPKR